MTRELLIILLSGVGCTNTIRCCGNGGHMIVACTGTTTRTDACASCSCWRAASHCASAIPDPRRCWAARHSSTRWTSLAARTFRACEARSQLWRISRGCHLLPRGHAVLQLRLIAFRIMQFRLTQFRLMPNAIEQPSQWQRDNECWYWGFEGLEWI